MKYLFCFLFVCCCNLQWNFGQIQEEKIDSIIADGIRQYAFPGATLLVAHGDSIIFQKTYGYHTYDSVIKVSHSDLYDLASITKISAPLPALMKLVDEGQLELDVPFSNYWKPWKNKKDKKDLTLREILAHQAGLVPYITFLNTVLKRNGKPKSRFIKSKPSNKFRKRVDDHLFVHQKFERKMYRAINRSKVSTEKSYRYSGLAFLLFPKIIEQLTGQDYESYLTTQFYQPIGAFSLGFNPVEKQRINKIVPTEIDTLFRHSLTKGWVHDENAALLGGISGNAGLFGTAEDVLKLMQLYQGYGQYNGQNILSANIVKEFTSIQFPENDNRRGLGFDKPLLGNDTLNVEKAYPAPSASKSSFGHAGFTGTFVWADPENQLVFIFLSNRVYPTRENRNLYHLHIRSKLHQLFYDAIRN